MEFKTDFERDVYAHYMRIDSIENKLLAVAGIFKALIQGLYIFTEVPRDPR